VDHDHHDWGDDDIDHADDNRGDDDSDDHHGGDDDDGSAAEVLAAYVVPAPIQAPYSQAEAEAERTWRTSPSVPTGSADDGAMRGAGEWVMPDEDTIERTPPDAWK